MRRIRRKEVRFSSIGGEKLGKDTQRRWLRVQKVRRREKRHHPEMLAHQEG